MGTYRYKGVNGVTYNWKFQYKGKIHTGTFDTDSEREAKDLFALAKARIRQGIEPARIEQSELLSTFLEQLPKRTNADVAHIYASIQQFFAGRRLDEIKPEHCRAWRDHRLAVPVRKQSATAKVKKRNPRTVNKEFSELSAIFTKAVEMSKLTSNPCHGIPGLKFVRKQPQIWTREHAEAALPFMVGEREHLLPLVLIALQTGLSRKDLFQLQVSEVCIGEKSGVIAKTRAKTGRPINIPLNAVALEILRPLVAGKRANAYVFVNQYTGKPFTTIVHSLDTVCRLADVPRITWHKFRHCVGTWLAEDGAGIEVIARFLGHSSYAMAATYVQLAAEKVRPQAEQLGAWVKLNTKGKSRIVEKASNVIFGNFSKTG
jgi:integrase